jgi:hypothetical protein
VGFGERYHWRRYELMVSFDIKVTGAGFPARYVNHYKVFNASLRVHQLIFSYSISSRTYFALYNKDKT